MRVRAAYLGDAGFYGTVLRVAAPIGLQQLVFNALGALDVLMIGQLGDTQVAAVGLANQVYFLMSLFLFGVGSGSVIFAAQFWGQRDVRSVRRVLGLGLTVGVLGSAAFTLAALLAPEFVLSLYSRDAAVVAAGSPYLRIAGLSYVPTAISTMYGMVLRSTREVKLPMVVAVSALSVKTVLAYGLIFGIAGLPALGMNGAAVAMTGARLAECAVLLFFTYRRGLSAAATPSEMFAFDRGLLRRFARTAWPVMIGEILWSLGITVYSGVYAHISTDAIAAVNIASTIEGIAFVPFIALANACAIILGNYIGAGEAQLANRYARRFLAMTAGGALIMGGLMAATISPILTLYNISDLTRLYALRVVTVLSFGLWLKASNATMIVGILRSGGDTRFALFADITPLWTIGVPLALLGGLVLHLPVYWVVLLVFGDEATKFVISISRVLTGRWINNLVQAA